jgi:signal transduction histidine kinase
LKNFFLIFFILFLISKEIIANNWEEIIVRGSGTVDIYYYPIEPFIFKDKQGVLQGIEKEIMDSFFRFVEKKYRVQIDQNWIEVNTFENLFSKVSHKEGNSFGISILSYTEKRAQSVSFSKAYMPDVNILVTHISIPLLNDTSQLVEIIQGFQAATIENTTYSDDLKHLSEQFNLILEFTNVVNDENIIQLVSENENMIGYVGLPFYVIQINRGIQVKRQTMFQIKRDGYRFIYNNASGWDEAVNSYFNSYLYKAESDKIIRKYLGDDFSELIWGLADNTTLGQKNNEVAFLNKEKEIQSISLLASQREGEVQRLIIISISIGLLSIIIIALLLIKINKNNAKDNRLLKEKRLELESLLKQVNTQKTEISQQRQLLQSKNKELTKINKQKDDLIGIVAHDLKSPINQMSGLINLLGFKNDTWDEAEIQIYNKLESSNQHLKELVERILDLEAIGKNILTYQMQEVDMAQLMSETVEDFKEIARAKSIQLLIDKNHKIPILADPFFLRLVFENLLSNAIKFSKPKTSVFISFDQADNYYQVSVRDEGPGISKDDQTKLFNKYKTLSAKPTGDESSTGLGLSIVKKYVEEMNGSVWCESELGKGANFIVSFAKKD